MRVADPLQELILHKVAQSLSHESERMFSSSLAGCNIGEQFRIAVAGGLFLGQRRQQQSA